MLTVVSVVTGGWVKDARAEPALGHPQETAGWPKDREALVIIEPVAVVWWKQWWVSVLGIVKEQGDGKLLRVLEVGCCGLLLVDAVFAVAVCLVVKRWWGNNR